jgi:flagellar basal body-associated protein FliL
MPELTAKPSPIPPPRKRHGLLLILAMVTLAGASFWLWVGRKGEAVSAEEDRPRVRSTVHLETFVLNLADPEQRSYLRVGIDLGLNHEPKHGEEPVPVAEVRDTILSVLGEAKVDDLLTAPGKARLKQDLLHAVQQRMPEAGVEEVYFTEFLVQR